MIDTIRNRHAFLSLRDKGVKKVTKPFILQARALGTDEPPRFGLTASKKIGNAVRRNRARRRMRALVRLHLADSARMGHHYGLIARFDMPDAPFDVLETEFLAAIETVHSQIEKRADKGPNKRPNKRPNNKASHTVKGLS